MKEQLYQPEFDFVSEEDKLFIIAFDRQIASLGYSSEGIKPYVCWGKYVISYSKTGNKTKKYIARFYFRDDCILLRMYFTSINKHRAFIEQAPEEVKSVFVNDIGKCGHCTNNCKDEYGNCSHRKTYTIDGNTYEKCDGLVFEFPDHHVDYIPAYMELIKEFYGSKR